MARPVENFERISGEVPFLISNGTVFLGLCQRARMVSWDESRHLRLEDIQRQQGILVDYRRNFVVYIDVWLERRFGHDHRTRIIADLRCVDSAWLLILLLLPRLFFLPHFLNVFLRLRQFLKIVWHSENLDGYWFDVHALSLIITATLFGTLLIGILQS